MTTEPTNASVQESLDAIAGRAGFHDGGIVPRPTTTPRSSTVLPTDVGTAATAKALQDQLAKTRQAISHFTTEVDSATAEMNKLWAQIQANLETLSDLKRSEGMLAAAITEGAKPTFRR